LKCLFLLIKLLWEAKHVLLKEKKNNRAGFTLIELMLVVAIIGILGAIVIPRFAVSQEAARTARVQADLRTIESAMVMFEADVGIVPATIAQMTSAHTPSGSIRSFGPYLKSTPVTPAGTVRIVAADGTGGTDMGNSYGISGGRAVLIGAGGSYTVENVR
jgi:type II secretion system protein G